MNLPRPYLIFVADVPPSSATKTALGVRQWAPSACLAQWRLAPEALDLGLPDLTPAAAVAEGARAVLIGVSPFGGQLPQGWIPPLQAALEAGLDIVSGLHQRLTLVPALADCARRHGRVLHDVRHASEPITLATGRRRSGRRVLTVGTDCALGKKYTALAIAEALRQRGVDARFRATGQTGIMIAGEGIALDAVVADFVAGAAEQLSPEAPDTHWDVIEGQGSILHPAYAGVTLGLLHGAQADALILCHEPGREELAGFPGFAVPEPADIMPLYVRLARVTNSSARFVGVALNTSALPESTARGIAAQMSEKLGLPCCDPLRFGIESVVDRLLEVA